MELICLKHSPQDLSAKVDVHRFASLKNLRRKCRFLNAVRFYLLARGLALRALFLRRYFGRFRFGLLPFGC